MASRDDNQAAVVTEALTRFFDATARGERPDIDEFSVQYGAYETQVKRRIADLQEIDALFDSLVHAAPDDFQAAAVCCNLIGQKLGSFEIERVIGRGGMGVVYLARDTKLDRPVAIKCMPAELLGDARTQARFRQEARLLASLNHPNIAVIHDIVEQADGVAYLVLEYVPGDTLAERVAHGPLSLEATQSIARQIAEAVSAAHDKGVVHRDLKPGNIKITPENRVKVLDFGLAKAIRHDDRSDATTATHPGRLIGTPAYMSPEQIRGRAADHRADIWAFGCILYEMLAGQRPFEGETVSDTIARTLEREPDWRLLPPRVPEKMRVLIQRCLEKDPEKRLQHISAATLEIGGGLSAPALRTQPLWAKAMVLVAVLAVVSVLLVSLPRRGPAPRGAGEKTLVVLPFDNLGPAEDDTFVAGITGVITARLAGIDGLEVIPRTSALPYAGTERNIQKIGAELGVDYILDGTVERERPTDVTSRLRIIPTLVRVSDSKQMWAEVYDSNMTDVFRVQSDLAERVAQALDITVLAQERQALQSQTTENLEAYDYYLRGNAYMERGCGQKENARVAVQMYRRAVDLDPEFVLAQAMLSEAHAALYFYGHDRSEARLASAKQAVDAAVRLAPDLPDVHEALGIYYYWGLLDYDRALEECAIVLRSRPNDSLLFVFIGAVQRRQGKWDQSLRSFEKAMKLDPRSSLSSECFADSSAMLRDYPQAERYFQRAISLSPDLAYPYARYIKTLLSQQGQTQKARDVLRQAREHVDLHEDDLLAYYAILLDIFDGHYAPAREFLSAHEALALETQFFYVPKAQLDAQISRLESDLLRAQESYNSARILLEDQIQERPQDASLRSALGIAYAGLGRRDDAIREGRLAVELLPVTKEAWAGLWRLEDLARIYTMVGEYDAALDQIEYLVQNPGELSIPLLDLDPVWDPLRDHPRLQIHRSRVGTRHSFRQRGGAPSEHTALGRRLIGLSNRRFHTCGDIQSPCDLP